MRERRTRHVWHLSATPGTTALWGAPPLRNIRAARATTSALEGPLIPPRWTRGTTPTQKITRKEEAMPGALANRGR